MRYFIKISVHVEAKDLASAVGVVTDRLHGPTGSDRFNDPHAVVVELCECKPDPGRS